MYICEWCVCDVCRSVYGICGVYVTCAWCACVWCVCVWYVCDVCMVCMCVFVSVWCVYV